MPTIDDARKTYASTLAFVGTRDELPLLLNQRGLAGCGVEVGVKEGEFSAHILGQWAGAHLISIDPWMEEREEAYVDIANVEQSIHESFYERTVARLAPHAGRSSIWRMTSTEASARIPHHSLDFVYLDARHDFDSVLEDLHAWFDRVRPGGIIAGHDYLDGHFPAGVFGVKSAVDAFFAERGLAVFSTLLDAPWHSWIVEIPAPAGIRAAGGAVLSEDGPPAVALVPEPQVVTLTLGNGVASREVKLVLDPARMTQRMMLADLEAGRFYEQETSQFIASVLRPGDTFVDVGTHIGYFSMLSGALVGPEGRVLSFEPDSDNFDRLRDHIRINGFEHVHPFNAAVGEAAGRAEFYVNADNDGGHALWDVGRHPFNELSRVTPQLREVEVVSLDAILATVDGPTPRVLKIDAEGAEMSVLRGARESLEARPIPFVICEINRFGLESMGASETGLRAFMTDLGYETHLFQPGETHLTELHAGDSVETGYVFNLLFRHVSAAA